MCGIAGSFGQALRPLGADDDLDGVLAHRGPDGFGRWQDDGVTLLHWRLAVIDLTPAGAQPMPSHDARLVAAYNGEVYNFQELRADIEREWARAPSATSATSATRHAWRGRSDTEVIVEGLALWGSEFLSRLNGMFALAVYDREARVLHLARDRAGVKPLYVWHQGERVLFASEAKFFFRVEGFAPGVDASGLTAFMTYGQCHDARHILPNVRQLEPGEVLSFERDEAGALAVTRARLAPRPSARPVSRRDADAAATLRALLARVVGRQLVADVPVGVLLSGGVDSSILTLLAGRHLGSERTQAFTLGYPGMGPDYDEIASARRVARHLGVQHHVYEASPSDLVEEVERLVWHYDEPFADVAALNVFLLCRMIRSRVTVALAGEGADELFGGYRRYHLEKTLRALGPLGAGLCAVVRAARLDKVGHVPRRLQMVFRAMARPGAAERYSSFLESETPLAAILKPEWHAAAVVHPEIRNGYPDALRGEPVGSLCVVDQRFWLPATYLEKSDKGAMAHGLEIRVPYLDNDVVAFANSLPDAQRIRGNRRKWLLQKAFSDLLPDEVFRRFKRGFEAPVSRWLRKELREYYVDQVLSPGARVRRYVVMPTLEGCFREHAQGGRDHSVLLWRCLVLEVWLRQLERGFRKPQQTGSERRDPSSGRMRPAAASRVDVSVSSGAP
jgi:asparagine synthase (glutamine-hydrolysing)